ncbi:unnamed protein product [Kuraishia capsulata CBS 1993]|uniref:Cyclin-D1-binding protein 1-like N-terminal domain-containing protein n=1 Tax=Kuraishia capsulata CBS 1993 TaxID=1382522 RepID=W6MQ49_9ASCO|nr:uncharacterized protein KUCA_T00003355001 [Kuraishia capsulata CBS 1993]CDK27377.1 unnamed protein product [Kuraishia capsulata CBS 1993]
MTNDNGEQLKQIIDDCRKILDLEIAKLKNEYTLERARARASTVNNALEELGKISKLIRAQTTKLGIVFKPPIKDDTVSTATQTLRETIRYVILLVSLAYQLYVESASYSVIFAKELKDKIVHVITDFRDLVNGLDDLVDQYGIVAVNADEVDDQSSRLVSVGKVWDGCDAVISTLEGGSHGVLVSRIKETIDIMTDAISELGEWLESPEKLSDPFDISSFNSDDDNDSHNEPETEIPEDTIAFGHQCLQKSKLVKLLIFSLQKSVPAAKSTSSLDEKKKYASQIDGLFESQRRIGEIIDDLACAIMVEQDPEEAETILKRLAAETSEILKLVKDLNHSDEKKINWANTWEAKYYE